MIYAGIGSRETPAAICDQMMLLGKEFARKGWMLRSGHAPGADFAFEIGAKVGGGRMEIFIPWDGFNGGYERDGYIIPPFKQEHFDLAASFHPNWEACRLGARKLHTRNVHQILGLTLSELVLFVVCWTKEGKGGGGTGQALRIAKKYGIPIYDLAIEGELERLKEDVG